MTLENKIQKLKSLLLYLKAHPDNEEYSECADRISDLEEIIKHEKPELNIPYKIT